MKEKILQQISKNSRLSSEDLAAMLAATPEEIQQAMQEMEEQGIICGYPTLINWDKVEDDDRITALIELKVAPERGRGFDKVAERIYQFEEVESLYLMSGGFDLTVIIVGKSMKEVARFVATKLAPMESIVSTATHFVLKKYKEHGLSLVEGKASDERQLITP